VLSKYITQLNSPLPDAMKQFKQFYWMLTISQNIANCRWRNFGKASRSFKR